VTFDLRAAARAHCPKALRLLLELMQHEDPEVRALAAETMRRFLERELEPEERPN
jgi:hypothetical protein